MEMSSWLARSLANSLRISDDEDEYDDDNEIHNRNFTSSNRDSHKPIDEEDEEEEEEGRSYVNESSSENLGRGVKEDLSDLTKTLTRQLRGVASFLAPPPHTPASRQDSSFVDSSTSGWNLWDSTDRSVSGETSDPEISESPRIDEIRGDLYENVENSDLSIDKAINEIPRIDSPVLLSGSELSEDKYPIGGAVGVTDEVLVFARNIAMHPETWLDFPLVDDEEFDDFDMSDAQYEHALAIERLAPRFAALRIELCPRHMSQGCFWKVYFVLLHSRLNKHDADLLSTPQIVEGRAMWMRELQKRTRPEPEPEWLRRGTSYYGETTYPPQEQHLSVSDDDSTEPMPLNKFNYETTHSVTATDNDTPKYSVVGTETRFIDKSVVEEDPVIHHRNRDLLAGVSKILDQKYDDDDGDDWLDDSSDIGEFSRTTIPLGDEDDVSFSDLEDEGSLHITSRPTISTKDTRNP